jgi:hypothetical protein
MLLTKDQILGTDDRDYREVEVPEWGGSVRLASMAASDRDAFEASMIPDKGKSQKDVMKNFRARFVARCCVDAEGNRLFSAADMAQLGTKNASVLNRLFDEARQMNGFSEEDVAEIEGNSESE